MTQDHPLVLLPNGTPATTAKAYGEGIDNSKAYVSGLHMYGMSNMRGQRRPTHRKIGDWTIYYAMYVQHPVIFAAINKLAQTAANTGYEFVPRDTRSEPRNREVNRLRRFFQDQPNFPSELHGIYQDLLIFGDAYMYIVPDRLGRPTMLKKLPPWTVEIIANDNGKVSGYVQRNPNNPTADVVEFDEVEILHFRIRDPNNDIYGLSPLEALKATVATDLQAMHYNLKFFENSASTGTIMSVKNASEDEIERNRKWLQENYVGTDMAHKPIVLEGDVSIFKSVETHQEMGFLEGRNFILGQILAVLNVPPSKLSFMENANRSNSKEQDKSFRAESVAPLQYMVESVINDQLLWRVFDIQDTIFKHSESDLRDAQDSMDLWGRGIEKGIYNINEIRSKLGYREIDGGDINFVMTPTGAVPVADLPLYFRLPQMNTEDIPMDMHSPPEEIGPEPDMTPPTQIGLIPSTKSLQTARMWIDGRHDDAAVRQAYSYVVDASEAGASGILTQARQSLAKAAKTEDDVLRLAYVERARSFIDTALTEEEERR